MLDVFLYAPKDVRIESIMEQDHVDAKKAREIVEYNDELNHSRHKYITGTHRGDRRQRDLLLDTSLLGWDKTAKYLLTLVEMLGE